MFAPPEGDWKNSYFSIFLSFHSISFSFTILKEKKFGNAVIFHFTAKQNTANFFSFSVSEMFSFVISCISLSRRTFSPRQQMVQSFINRWCEKQQKSSRRLFIWKERLNVRICWRNKRQTMEQKLWGSSLFRRLIQWMKTYFLLFAVTRELETS